MIFEPIAIIGRACLLPGADSPAALWQALREGRDLSSAVPAGRWRSPRHLVMGTPSDAEDRSWCDRGGYVVDPQLELEGLALSPAELVGLDPLFLWLLHTGRAALRDAGDVDVTRAGAVMGNLSFPSAGMARFAERVWLGQELASAAAIPSADPRNRFTSGLPAHLLAEALGLGDEAFCLDAACASSLVAIKLACDRLQERRADTMLAGAVCCADDLFIHVGFCALQAMSRVGMSRPFHRDADGLVPAEGCGVVVLERLADAERKGRNILGVIRGIGLSNDGRGKGFLAPSEDGQVRAMELAYASAQIAPTDVHYVECHATGTEVGDATEIRSMARVFGGHADLPIGSIKSNLGHAITAAGIASLLKVLGAMEAALLPPTIHASEALSGDLEGTPLRVVHACEPWPSDGPRRAAVSSFGFGGNNAHLIVEQYRTPAAPTPDVHEPPATPEPIAIVAAEVVRPEADGAIVLDPAALRFPPRDLEQTLGQQLLLMAAAGRALARVPDLPHRSTGVIVGMGCDPEVARYGARWRGGDWARRWGAKGSTFLNELRGGFVSPLQAAGVLGTMPNIVANRINSAFDLRGSSMAVSAEELSGVRALTIACRALRRGEMDAALVGAVDLSDEPVHRAALAALAPERTAAADDTAVVLVLERVADAERLGHTVLATVAELPAAAEVELARHGAHAAAGLLAVADAMSAASAVELHLGSLGGQRASLAVTPRHAGPPPHAAAGGLRLRARFPAVVLPAFPEPSQQRPTPPYTPAADVLQPMSPAPWLAPITNTELAVALPSPTVPSQPVARAPVVAQVATTPAWSPARLLSQQHVQVTAQHRSFLTQQAAMHEQFLGVQARLRQQWLDLSATIPAPPAPAPPPAVAPVAAATPIAASSPTTEPSLPGFTLDRAQLEVHAAGPISSIFGAELAAQDGYLRQVRMPRPPLLLADRMTGIDAQIGSMGLGTIWTETDVVEDSWYLHQRRMPAGIMIESGQADLMLISYLGIDLLNRSERVYRLLGCDLTYHGPLPQPGDTLVYDIHVDGHASQGDVRLFFFHYDCRVDGELRLSVRGGQAGFFSDEELESSAGVLWDADTATPCQSPRLDPPPRLTERRAFSSSELGAFAAGRPLDCFGPGFERAAVHTRSPCISAGPMLFLDEVTHFEPQGGAWGRGYLRAVDAIAPDDWFFDGHFHNDPCMPGTLMFEGCLQAMAVYLAALGFTLSRDGWRFEPVPDQLLAMRCRGQVTPSSSELVYEVFVEEIIGGETPTIVADLLCTVDGRKAFHCRRAALRLVPDWPLDEQLAQKPELADLRDRVQSGPVARIDGFDFGYDSLLACAWGRPSRAFPSYQRFDNHRRVARLPGPPYHFMSRVAEIDGELAKLEPGQSAVVDYDIPADAWYFDENGVHTMPYCVLLEAALQPCGWLASFVGSALSTDIDLCFRNLDGTATQHRELLPEAGTLSTRTKITNISATAGMIIESFEVECTIDGELVFDMKTVFGFFPEDAFDNQVGLPVPAHEQRVLDEASNVHVDLSALPEDYFAGSVRLAKPALRMIDRVTGIWPEGGVAGLGRYRAEKDVTSGEWFFKAHFFQDPVQPGSLGIEAMIQLLQVAMLHRGLGRPGAHFEPIAIGTPLTWKYRGQVTPANRVVSTVVDLIEVGEDERGPYAVANASLWVDGKRIYEASHLGMRVVADAEELLDPRKDLWLQDHCPTFTVPALPLMSMVDRLAAAAPGRVVGMDRLQVERWLPITAPTRLSTERDGDQITLLAWRQAPRAELSRFEPVARATIRCAADYPVGPAPLPELDDARDVELPYDGGRLFHGPALHKLRRLRMGASGASAVLDAEPGLVPLGSLNQALLDAATHAIPHDELGRWCAQIGDDVVGYPHRIDELTLHGPTPSRGDVRCEVRFIGFDEAAREPSRLPMFAIQLIVDDRVWLACRLVEILMPKGPLGAAPAADRRAFLRDRRPVRGLSLSRYHDSATRLSSREVRESNWLPGTLETLYGVSGELVEPIAAKEHAGRLLGVHPSTVSLSGDTAVAATLPLTRVRIEITRDGDDVVVQSPGGSQIDLREVRAYWSEHFAIGRWPVEDLYYGLIERFVGRVHLAEPAAFRALSGRSVLYLANHQVAIESLLFSIIAAGLSRVPTVTLAKAEHRSTWLGLLIQHCFAYPGIDDPGVITYFDRSDPQSLAAIIADLAAQMMGPGKSVMVHVEGTRSLDCRTPVVKMSSAFIDMALGAGVPIVPVRFVGALPTEPAGRRLELPLGMGRQDIHLGAPIYPETFASLPYKERKPLVIDAINALGPNHEVEQPFAPDPAFAAAVAAHVARTQVSEEHAVLYQALAGVAEPTEPTRRLLAARDGAIAFSDSLEDRWLRELIRRLLGR